MPTRRSENRGRRRSRHDDAEDFHRRNVNDSSIYRRQIRNRGVSSPEEQNKDRRKKRKRPRSTTRRRRRDRSFDSYDHDEDARHYYDEDKRVHDRRSGRERKHRSRRHRRKQRQRSRSPSYSSSSQESHYHSNRRSRKWKRRRSSRVSRRSRSRSHSITEQEYDRKAQYDRRYSENDERPNNYRRRNPSHDEAVRLVSRAGVVSDDDEGYQNTDEQQKENTSKIDETTIARSSRTGENHEVTTLESQNMEQREQHNNVSHHNLHNSGKNSTKNSSNKKSRKSSPPSSTQDDTIGHFHGRDGCVISDRYRILREVGVGTFGRVVECLDIRRGRERRRWDDDHYFRRENDRPPPDQYLLRDDDRERERQYNNPNNIVAIKIVRNIKRYYDSAKIEADIIRDVNRRGRRGLTHCAIMYDTFSFDGHYCMVFESLGPSLYDFLKSQKYHPFPIQCIRDFAIQLLETLEFLHSFRLIHTDLKPENILLLNGKQVPQRGGYSIPESTRIKVIDFGGATYDDEKKSSIVNTRQYRAPEVILGVGWSMPSDLWSIGCILAELYQGELLFATHDNIEHLALIEQVVGSFPRKMLKRAKNTELVHEAFNSNGSHRMGRVLGLDKLSYVKRVPPLESIVSRDGDDAWFLWLLHRILVIDPDERASAKECLRKL